MNDRYLYKAKRVDNGEWEIGYLYRLSENTHPFIMLCGKCGESHEVDEHTICQCTGLKDKNGKLIWENDVCDRKEDYHEIVKYKGGDWTIDYSYALNMKAGNGYCNLGFYAQERKCVEVIGNIFDNPELLERKR